MARIILSTLNARYHHASFGLRYLRANLGELRESSRILEFTINESALEIADRIIEAEPDLVGFGIYIWNVRETERVIRLLKSVRPEMIIVLGGPEVSFESEQQRIVSLADYVIRGEADLTFARLCRQLLGDDPDSKPRGAVDSETELIDSRTPALDTVRLPYEEYTGEDLANRVLYVEASRGCPFTCEFCLSALEIPVRRFPLQEFLDSLQDLLDRGALQFKFVDRTFNLNLRFSRSILEFFLDRLVPGLFLHFEMIPDRLPTELRNLVARFPPGVLQFEIGIQTFDHVVSERISRPMDASTVEENLLFLREQTNVHLHTDLIVGLPGEDLDSFGCGFNRLLKLGPHEIQVGILKRLRGTPIVRHEEEFQMIFSPDPPYELLCHAQMDYVVMARMRRFARFWDMLANSGRFHETIRVILSVESPFHAFLELSDWLFEQMERAWGISTIRLAELLFHYQQEQLGLDPESAAETVWSDYTASGRSDRPSFLRGFNLPAARRRNDVSESGKRQMAHARNQGERKA